jgi:hypothetical protein
LKKTEEEKLLADLYLQLGGSKTKRDDWITIAKKCKRLLDHYGSTEKLAEKVGRSYQLVRSILCLLTLPEEVQQVLRERRIGYDAAQRLYRLRDNPEKQIEVARSIATLSSHKSREVIQYAKNYPNSGLVNYTQRVAGQSTKPEKIHVAIVPLREETYRFLDRSSGGQNISVGKLIVNILDEWVEKRSRR